MLWHRKTQNTKILRQFSDNINDVFLFNKTYINVTKIYVIKRFWISVVGIFEMCNTIKRSKIAWRDTVEINSCHWKLCNYNCAMKYNVITSVLMIIILAIIFNNGHSEATPNPKNRCKLFLDMYLSSFTNEYFESEVGKIFNGKKSNHKLQV